MPGLAEEGGCDEAGRSFRCAFLPVFLSLCLRWRSAWNPMDGNIKGSPLCGGLPLMCLCSFSLGVKRAVSCLCGRGCRDSLPLHHRDETADDEQDDERQCAPSIHFAAAVEAASRRVDGHCLCRCTAPQCGEQRHSCHFLFHSLVVMIVLRVPVQVCSVLLLLLFLLFFGDSVQKMEESES